MLVFGRCYGKYDESGSFKTAQFLSLLLSGDQSLVGAYRG